MKLSRIWALSLLLLACRAQTSVEPALSTSAGSGAPNAAGHSGVAGASGAQAGQSAGSFSSNTDPSSALPAGLTQTEVGGYKLGEELTGDEVPPASVTIGDGSAGGCSVMTAVVRDFKGADEPGGHPDFETFQGQAATTGLLAMLIGGDDKPVYASHCEAMPDKTLCPYGQMTTSKAQFDEWYRTTAGVNRAYVLFLHFSPNAGVYTFQSNAFFPLDAAGFAAETTSSKKTKHNYHFTTEVHARFLYSGGERFSFTGDDDLWVFVNGKLAIDLGGLHPKASATLDLDKAQSTLGIERGQQYPLDLFHAERHTTASNFRVDTTLAFTDCGRVIPPQ